MIEISESALKIDYARIMQIVRDLRPLDEYEAYYVKDAVQAQRIGPLVPNIGGILRNLFHPSRGYWTWGVGTGIHSGDQGIPVDMARIISSSSRHSIRPVAKSWFEHSASTCNLQRLHKKSSSPDLHEFFRHYCVSWTTYDAAESLGSE